MSWETSTRPCFAASAKTSGSVVRRNPAACAVRKSTVGSRRRTPVRMALLRSASARKRILTTVGRNAVRRERASASHAGRLEAIRHCAFPPSTFPSAQLCRHRCRAGWRDTMQWRRKPPPAEELQNSGRRFPQIRRVRKHRRSNPARLASPQRSNCPLALRCIPWPPRPFYSLVGTAPIPYR